MMMNRKSNVVHKFGQGISPIQFMEGMTQNKERFLEGYEQFQWTSKEDQEFFESLRTRKDVRALIVAADWCTDVVRNIPVVFHLFETAGIPAEVLILEEHAEIMDEYLTLGGRSVPIVIVADLEGNVLGYWGPRPAHIQEIMAEFKSNHPDREADGYQEGMVATRAKMIEAYGGATSIHPFVVAELREMLSRV